jgi:hypothetical protein
LELKPGVTPLLTGLAMKPKQFVKQISFVIFREKKDNDFIRFKGDIHVAN